MKSILPVRLDGRLTLAVLEESRALEGFPADALLVVECEPGWYALLAAGALQALLPRLHGANNFWLAGVWLNTTLSEFLRPIAKQSDAPPAGPSRNRPPDTVEALLIALQIERDALEHPSQMSEPPEIGGSGEEDAAGETAAENNGGSDSFENIDELSETIDELLDEKSGGGSDAGDVSKGDLGGASEAETAPTSPPAQPLQREEIRLDVVTPETATVNEPFDMAVAIRQPNSPQLTVEDLPKLTTAMGEVYRETNQTLIKYRVEVSADDCEVKPAHYDFLLAKGRNSIVQYFQLTPKRAGNLSIIVNAYQADSAVLAATTRVRLKAGVSVLRDGATPAQADTIKLYDALTTLFQLDDVQDIAFRMNIKWDELAGDTLSAKCRSLLTYCNDRSLIDALRQTVKTVRPDASL